MDFKSSWDDHLPPIKFAYNSSYHSSIQMAPYEALYGRKCRSFIGWFKIGETKLVGPELVQQEIEKIKLIRERLLGAQSHQKSYVDNRRRDLEFQVDDWVFLKVSPMKGVMRFGNKEKFSPWYIRPYKIIHGVGQVAYELNLPFKLESVHPVFHVSMLQEMTWAAEEEMKTRYPHLFPLLKEDKTETSQPLEEITWAAEEEMKTRYPHLFPLLKEDKTKTSQPLGTYIVLDSYVRYCYWSCEAIGIIDDYGPVWLCIVRFSV
ncbi:uncharacterized protein [Nicotiana tomentosiformis]|uniref:uncharacterized protein n=1 Tax=Nicotiana tomentosiformis TaxID=4098 RepID=UPI00388C6AE7